LGLAPRPTGGITFAVVVPNPFRPLARILSGGGSSDTRSSDQGENEEPAGASSTGPTDRADASDDPLDFDHGRDAADDDPGDDRVDADEPEDDAYDGPEAADADEEEADADEEAADADAGPEAAEADDRPETDEPEPDDTPQGEEGPAATGTSEDDEAEADEPTAASEGAEDISDTPAPSVGPHTTFEREDPEKRLARHDQSGVDAMGLDKRREVVGGSYGPSLARQATLYGIFVLVVGLLVVGGILAVNEFDQPPEQETYEAPWKGTTNPARASEIDFPREIAPRQVPVEPDSTSKGGADRRS